MVREGEATGWSKSSRWTSLRRALLQPNLTAEAQAFVSMMRKTALGALKPVATNVPYALLDYPDHANVGDTAIWLGTLELLRELNGRPPAYVATLKNFDARRCGTLIGEGTVYLLGGGNLGNVYAKHHSRRLAVIAALTRNRVVQLPQSISNNPADQTLTLESRQLYHRANVTLYCRDHASLRTAEDLFATEGRLCPDLAFGIGLLERAEPIVPISTLLRRDHERKRVVKSTHLPEEDWRDCPSVMSWRWRGNVLEALTNRLDPAGIAVSMSARRWVSQGKLRAGARFLSRGEFLITDRLHGHILAILLALPHATLDTSGGKLSAFRSTWTDGLSFARSADRVQSALQFAADAQGLGAG
jgi:exopolysaccharide biosynthesis predicted pyruvyltransferase EpsI